MPDAMVVQKAVLMDAVSVPVTASAVAVIAAVADAAVAKAAAQKDALKVVQKDVLKIATKVVAESAANAARKHDLKRVQKVCARSVRTALLAKCAAKRLAMTAVQTDKPVVTDSNATKPVPKTASRANHVLKVRAVNAPAANVATAQNGVIAVTAYRAMPWSKTLRWPTRPPWQPPCVGMALNRCKTVPRRTLAAMKAAVNVVTATVAETIAAVNAQMARTPVVKEMARSILKRLHHSRRQRQRLCWMQRVIRPPQSRATSKVKSNVNPGSAAAVTVMAATAANVVTTPNAAKQALRPSQRPMAAQHPLIRSQKRLSGSKNGGKLLLNL